MMIRFFCKIALLVLVVCGLLAFSGVLFAQGQNDDALARAIDVQERHTNELMAKSGVVGTAIGEGQGARPVILVLLEAGGVPGIPDILEGVPVRPLVTGKIYANAKPDSKPGGGKPGGGTLSPTDRWPRPVPIGVSTGNEGECSAGTISCRVKDGSGNVYALSNNHVYALENNASVGSEVLQPGLYDTSCAYNADNVIGALSQFVQISFTADNTIDAAIASTTTGNLGVATPTNGYGIPLSTTTGAQLNQAVQKYGRTTGLTKGQVTAINATINVGYTAGTARFTNQIVVYGSRGAFLKAGDSGSLLVTDPGKSPVGLLFAGDMSGKYGIANPIDAVLAAFQVTVDNGQ